LSGKTLTGFKLQLKPNFFAIDLEKVPGLEINKGEKKEVKIPIKLAKKRNI
jgi:hypothetical protein